MSVPVPPSPSDSVVLLCVDLQPAFLKVIPGADGLLRRCAFAIEAAEGLGIRTVFSEQVPEKLGGTAPELIERALNAPVFAKTTFSAWAHDPLRAALSSPPTEHLLLCGIETSVCVYQTALDALAAGLSLTVLSDGVGARRPDDARVCLDALARAGAHVLPAETVFYAMLQDVTHPFFKRYTQLVKTYG
ncbi:MAG: isochorismatase family protein [Opitutus sp.]